jgi:hypothetical protein
MDRTGRSGALRLDKTIGHDQFDNVKRCPFNL